MRLDPVTDPAEKIRWIPESSLWPPHVHTYVCMYTTYTEAATEFSGGRVLKEEEANNADPETRTQ